MLDERQRRAKTRSYIFLMLMVLGSLGLDQATKHSVQEHLLVWEDEHNLRQYQGTKIPVFTVGTQFAEQSAFWLNFNLNYVRNLGAAWGTLSDMEDWFRVPFFYGVTFFAVIMIIFYLRSLPLGHRVARFALALVLSGALGNCLDRIQHGYVIDFLDFRWAIPLPFTIDFTTEVFPAFLQKLNGHWYFSEFRYDFPNFNWADSAISVGMFFLIFDMLILENMRRKTLAS